MKNSARFFLAITLVLLFISTAGAQNSMKIKQIVLPNGLTVILNEDHTVPKIFGLVVTKAGAKNDPADASGMAHYQEHMLFKGTEDIGTTNWEKEKPHIENIFRLYDLLAITTTDTARKRIQGEINAESLNANQYAIPNEIDKLIKMMGGIEMNANTSYDRTVYYNDIPSGQLEKWLELYSNRFMNPVFRSFQAELEVVYEEKNLYSDMFQMNLLEAFQKVFFKDHPYGRPVIGTIEHLKTPSLTKMYDFFRTYYVANNMALILSGDFNTEEVIPLIEEKFSKWRQAQVPALPEFRQDSFKGREYVEDKLSPIKLALLGFRTVPTGHPDELALKVFYRLLSNSSQTGLLDKLSIDNKLLAAVLFPYHMNDQGAGVVFVIPKIVGQSPEEAEKLVLAEIDKIKKGEFEDWKLEAIKNEFYREFHLEMESIDGKAVRFAELFASNQNINEYLQYPEKVKNLRREDIIRVAATYFGPNYLAFVSKMGFPKKEKIEKPGYKPVISNLDSTSLFAKKLLSIPTIKSNIKYIDFETDIKATLLPNGARLLYVPNPYNDIFNLTISFGAGNTIIPNLQYASQMMNYAGTKNMTVSQLKEEFSKIGCTYSIGSDDSYLHIYLQGIEKNLEEAVRLLNELLYNTVLEQEKLKILEEGEKANRKMEKSEPDNVADALFDFVKYGNRSGYIERLTMKEIKNLKSEDLVKTFHSALYYQPVFHFCGQAYPAGLSSLLDTAFIFGPSQSPIVKAVENYTENTVFFVNKKKAIQSKIYLFANGDIYENKMDPSIEAFNLYFSGDFSGLVLQEIREYRSLAYGAGANYSMPALSGKPTNFYGYVGTQADKTIEAIEVFTGLIRNMPEKVDRINMIKEYLVQSSISSRPDFRNLSSKVEYWKYHGYKEDPLISKLPAYNSLEFKDIVKFHQQYLKNKPLVIAIVGNKDRIDLKALKNYGKVINIKEKSLFRD